MTCPGKALYIIKKTCLSEVHMPWRVSVSLTLEESRGKLLV